MSKIRKRKLRKFGLNKKSFKKARKYISSFPKCNQPFAFQNIAANLGLNDNFWIYGYKI